MLLIVPISSITSSNVYIKRINKATKSGNSTVLWWLLRCQITLYNSNISGVSIYVSEQSFPNQVLKISGYIFWLRLLYSKLLKIIISHLSKSVNQRSELRQFSKGNLISISLESSKIHLLMKVLYRPTWFNLCRQYFLFYALNVSLY